MYIFEKGHLKHGVLFFIQGGETMTLAIILTSILLCAVVTSLRILVAYNRFEETRRDSEWDK